jgi:peptidoglycan/xylan/chitin deacetylase (PgdA/CDA1 family)
MTLILTYHAVEDGPAPLCVDPKLFAEHVAAIAASGAKTLMVSELAAALRAGSVPEHALVITFDDGCASVVEQAAPVLREHGIRATVFCVAGRLGGANDWPTQAAWAPRLRLASAEALATLAGDGWEIGSHGVEHSPLATAGEAVARREVMQSQLELEQSIGTPVPSFAWPYGVRPSAAATTLIAETYHAACAGGLAVVCAGADPLALPRVDAHYLRNPAVLRRALRGSSDGYLALRRAGARLRRTLRHDYAREAAD